jgi:hypothetical protein
LTVGSSFTVFFDGTYWVGVAEICEPDGRVRAARHIFGAEPSNAELLDFVRRDASELLDRALASPGVPPGREPEVDVAPRMSRRRAARAASREQTSAGPSTAAQAALSRAREASSEALLARTRDEEQERARRRRQAKVEKKKAKHRGR